MNLTTSNVARTGHPTPTASDNPLVQIDFYVKMLQRSWWIIVLVTIIALNA